jgi:hypothetical protein
MYVFFEENKTKAKKEEGSPSNGEEKECVIERISSYCSNK